MFQLHPTLKKDCYEVLRFPLSTLLLMNDASFPWCILVPRREGIREIFELSEEEQVQLIKESSCLSRRLADSFSADKINVAALGNVVSQLHIHHIVRFKDDAAWPGPVWGAAPAIPYDDDNRKEVLRKLRTTLAKDVVTLAGAFEAVYG